MINLMFHNNLNLHLFQNQYIILLLILCISLFIHTWNIAEFPSFHVDEGIYIDRSLYVLNGLGSQEFSFYDHPFFGQYFLAGIFYLIGYPYNYVSNNIDSISSLWFIPRLIFGILAVINTFLIFKISSYLYGNHYALFSASLFAMMPIGWMTRRIFLSSTLYVNSSLPYITSVILFTK